ncbi:MAG: hypothetical protein H6767_06765 [Candidatus Peribacteria bacterium]|nr:MAG: hypothetical protein H6767_06765 [Candidatus Peribacteria bacterium]
MLLGLQIYWSYEDSQIDRNSYLVVMEGTAKIDTMTVSPGTRYKLENDMTVTTLGDESLAVVEWGDGSVTRL